MKHTFFAGLGIASAMSIFVFACGNAATEPTVSKPAPESPPPVVADSAPTRPRASINSVKAVRAAGSLYIVASIRAGTNTTQLTDTAAYGATKVGHLLPGTALVDTIILPLPDTSVTGTYKLWAGNTPNGWNSTTPATATWTYQAPVVVTTPPPNPTAVTLVPVVHGTQLWLKSTWVPAAGATSYVDTLHLNVSPWSLLGGHSIGVTSPDSFAVAMPTTTTSYYICVRSVNSFGSSPGACNNTSYTPPASVPIIDSLRAYPTQVSVDTANPIGTSYALSVNGLTETAKTGRAFAGATKWATSQFCAYVHVQNQGWARVSNDTNVTRCNNLWAALPFTPKLSKHKKPMVLDEAHMVAAPGLVFPQTLITAGDQTIGTVTVTIPR